MYVVDPITAERGLRARFMEAFNSGENPADIMPFTMETESDGSDEKYGWLGQSPSMSLWVDERKVKGLLDFDYTIPNLDYEATIGVDRNSFKDDRMGAINTRIDDLAKKARVHPRALFYEKLVSGTTDLCYDGQPFFSASHVEGESGTQSNIHTGGGITLALIKADLQAVIAKMKRLKDDRGEPFDEGEVTLGIVCPPELEAIFDELNTETQISSNSNNSMKGKLKSIVSSGRLTDVNDYYVANISEGIKPLILQERQAPEFTSLTGDSEAGFFKKKWHYGVDVRRGFGYGLWQKMFKVTNA